MGFTMMPVFTGAMQSLKGSQVARGSTLLNILQQTGASIGTAVLTVVLATAITARLGAGGSISSAHSLTPEMRERVAPLMASAFGHAFWWAFGLLVIAFFGSLLLPRTKPELPEGAAPIVPL